MNTHPHAEHTQHLDLRGCSKAKIEMQILHLFSGNNGRINLDCLFDDDPNDALRDLERHSCHWNFQRLGHAHWIVRNYAMTWEESFGQLGFERPVTPYEGRERREQERH